eukprot:CAMPEP_0197833078 /NCGR_PEP_ID=MMETSP1437-20131217/17633_1 /TAXON_ID=49252 ORGANISM="Eucampia antarctica, Strain CCMP1452" /NCGR_SAMPLE_ID=MMETSP1437 /ASSEMBLY_ACC=CAM_ASM_001096 /LENGTH=102 /DNA_ID=CAMNT_0043436883 /DNA_START=1 /DNA_END=306 /DNA_ORIENTATION=+
MSKIIRYFPSSIPRILINQNLVKPPNLSVEELKKNSLEENDDFRRDGYVFDACLLGFCDDITSHILTALVDVDSDKNITKQTKVEGKILYNVVQNNNDNNNG